jgi:hypothetical protein
MASKKKHEQEPVPGVPEPQAGEDVTIHDGFEVATQKKVDSEPEKVDYTPTKPEEKTLYWMGTIPGGPFQSINISKFSFNGFTMSLETDPTSDDNGVWTSRAGCVMELSDKEVKDLKEIVTKKRVVREYRDKRGYTRGQHLTVVGADGVRNPEYYPNNEQDYPLACYIYMVKIGDKYEQPLLSNFTNKDWYKPQDEFDGEVPPFAWYEPRGWLLDRFPAPMARKRDN